MSSTSTWAVQSIYKKSTYVVRASRCVGDKLTYGDRDMHGDMHACW